MPERNAPEQYGAFFCVEQFQELGGASPRNYIPYGFALLKKRLPQIGSAVVLATPWSMFDEA
jgi:hypothetical protein